MCFALSALLLIAAPCPPASYDRPSPQPVRVASAELTEPRVEPERFLTDPELDRIRGGRGFVLAAGPNGTLRLVQDGNVRDMNIGLLQTTQQMDAWWGEVGSAYIAAGLLRR